MTNILLVSSGVLFFKVACNWSSNTSQIYECAGCYKRNFSKSIKLINQHQIPTFLRILHVLDIILSI